MHQCSFSIRGGKKHYILIILIINIIISYDQNISLIFYVNDGSHVRLRHPSCVYITAQRQYTAVLKIVHFWNDFPCLTSLFSCPSSVLVKMIYCSVSGLIIMKSIKTPTTPLIIEVHVLLPQEVWVRGLYNSWWFCVHKLSMFIYLSMSITFYHNVY